MIHTSEKQRVVLFVCTILAIALLWVVCAPVSSEAKEFSKNKGAYTTDFRMDACTFTSVGSNEYFILEPGYQLILQGEEHDVVIDLTITVLDETEMIDGIETRVVEEEEREDGELVEVSRNFFAICVETNSVFYFGEDVDIYEDGEIVSHEGAWRAFDDGNLPGLMMPGIILLGSRYYQEFAPDVALDRAEIVADDEDIEVSAGPFENCLVTLETTPLENNAMDFKVYAPGVGLIIDGPVELIGIVVP